MARLRGVDVFKHDNHAWHWYRRGHRWDFRLSPAWGLWCQGKAIEAEDSDRLLCVDDAILYSLGYERSEMTKAEKEGDVGKTHPTQ